MIIIGIDPGVSGAISVLENKKVVEIFDMPTMIDGKKNKKQVNGNQLFNEIKSRLSGINEEEVCVEIINEIEEEIFEDNLSEDSEDFVSD